MFKLTLTPKPHARKKPKKKKRVVEGTYLPWLKQKILVALHAGNVSGRRAAQIVGCDKDTACDFYRKLREKMKTALGGRVSISTDSGAEGGASAPTEATESVEMDEMYLGSERERKRAGKVTQAQRRRDSINPKKKGRGTAKFCIVGAIERGTGKVCVRRVPNASAAQLYCFAADHFAAGTTVYTDGWLGYSRFGALGFNHHTVNHSRGEYVRTLATGEKVHTNTIENVWRQIKQRMRPYFGGFKRNVDLFLAEAVFYFRKQIGDAMRELGLLRIEKFE